MFNRNFDIVKNCVCSVSSELGTGTGWLYRRTNNISRDKTIYVVTAAHMVVERKDNVQTIYQPSILVNNVNNSGNNQMFETKVISIDMKGDIALLEIQNHRGEGNKYPLNWLIHGSLRVNTNKQPIGIPIYIVGYPLAWDYNSFVGGYLRENNASDFWTPTSLYYNLATNAGNSGSPVFNSSNEVIGMLQWGLNNGDELNGGIRGDILYYFLETSITAFLASNKTSYNSIFQKNYIGFFINTITSFIPLSCELIRYLNLYNLGNGYKNGGRNINGILLLNNDYITNFVIESIVYTDYRNITKTIVLSSCVYDRDSIWDIIYYGKRDSNITLNIYNISTNTTFSVLIKLDIMPDTIDFYLTEGFSNKEIYNKLLNKLKNQDNDTEMLKKIKDNSDLFINSIQNQKK